MKVYMSSKLKVKPKKRWSSRPFYDFHFSSCRILPKLIVRIITLFVWILYCLITVIKKINKFETLIYKVMKSKTQQKQKMIRHEFFVISLCQVFVFVT